MTPKLTLSLANVKYFEQKVNEVRQLAIDLNGEAASEEDVNVYADWCVAVAMLDGAKIAVDTLVENMEEKKY